MTTLSFFVPGIPRPGGSKKGFYIAKIKRVVITDASGKPGKDWRGDVKAVALQAYKGDPLDEPLRLSIEFTMPRPKNHYRSNGQLKPGAPHFHTSKPDTTKLIRSLEDALTGILWKDDSSVCMQSAVKVYGEKPGARVTLDSATTQPSIEVALTTRTVAAAG